MTDSLAGLLTALDLTDTGARTEEDIYTGQSQWTPIGRVFGGQVLAQALVAAQRTIAPERSVHSLHGYFLRPGDVNLPITFSVDRIHDGRSFSTRRTQAYQSGLPILSLILSFQDHDEGLDHQDAMPEGIPEPEGIAPSESVLDGLDHPVAMYWREQRPFEMRHVEAPIYLEVDGEHVARQAVWFRAVGRLPNDPTLHCAALAYASDYTLLESAMRRHGLAWAQEGLKIASLDHAMWFHRFARVDDWLLYVQDSPSASGGRALATARVFTREGLLVATVAQEGMIRVPPRR